MAIFPNGYGKVCIQSETSNNSTTFTNTGSDNINLLVNGNVYHSTDNAKFGSSSIKTDNSYLYFNVIDNTEPYTLIDFWIYPTNNNTYLLYCSDVDYIFINNLNKLSIKWRKAEIIDNIYISLNTWNHIYIGYDIDIITEDITCSERDIFLNTITGNGTRRFSDYNIRFALNGVVYAASFDAYMYSCLNTQINTEPPALTTYQIGFVNGYFEDIRFDNQNLITEIFLPFDIAYPASNGNLSGLVKYKTEFANRMIRVYNRNTKQLLTTTNSNNDGVFDINNLLSGECFIICLDDNENEELNALIYDNLNIV